VRLLFVQTAPDWTGTTRVFTTVAHALATRGYDTAIVAPEGSEALRICSKSQAQVLELTGARQALFDTRRLASLVEAQRPDTVFVHTEYEHLVVAGALKRVGKGSLVRRIAAGERFAHTPRTRRAERTWPTRYLYTTDSPPSGHAAPSGTLTSLRADLGVPVPETRAVASGDGYGVLACVASREALRRATNVLRAAALLAQYHTSMRVRVIGSAAADPDLQVLASALGLGRRVDWITHAASTTEAFAEASAGWVIGDGDDAGLGLLQLMAHGIVPLAERTPVASRYITPGVHGILMANLEPTGMAAETTVLLSDAERRLKMGAAGRARVEHEFTLRDMLAGFEQAARAWRDRRTPP
jgi:hypothetical protein